MRSTDTAQTPEAAFQQAVKDITEGKADGWMRIHRGTALLLDYVRRQAERVESDNVAVKEQIKDGSRLSKHRFSV